MGSDPVHGVRTSLIKEDGQLYFHHESDNRALVAENKRLNTQPQRGKWRLAARTPAHLEYIDWPVEFEIKHGSHPHKLPADTPFDQRRAVRKRWKEFKRAKLNSRDFQYLRVDDGRKI